MTSITHARPGHRRVDPSLTPLQGRCREVKVVLARPTDEGGEGVPRCTRGCPRL